MKPFHKLLQRQLKKHRILDLITSLSVDIQEFIYDVNEAYWENENDRLLLERSMELSSNELIELNRLREQHQARLVAASRMSTLGEMAGGIAHEINSPLATIVTLAGQVRDLLEENPLDTHLIHGHIDKIEETTQKIAKMIRGLREAARNSSSDPLILVPLIEVIENVLSLCRERFSLHGIRLTIHGDPQNHFLKIRPAQIAQILTHLLNNAFDAVRNCDEKWIEIETRPSPDFFEILVTDSGSPLPAAVQEKLFHPFFTTKEIGKGTGLGLSISRTIAQEHGGDLFYNNQSKNTQFILKLAREPKAS